MSLANLLKKELTTSSLSEQIYSKQKEQTPSGRNGVDKLS